MIRMLVFREPDVRVRVEVRVIAWRKVLRAGEVDDDLQGGGEGGRVVGCDGGGGDSGGVVGDEGAELGHGFGAGVEEEGGGCVVCWLPL